MEEIAQFVAATLAQDGRGDVKAVQVIRDEHQPVIAVVEHRQRAKMSCILPTG